jgi:hypothetical protein
MQMVLPQWFKFCRAQTCKPFLLASFSFISGMTDHAATDLDPVLLGSCPLAIPAAAGSPQLILSGDLAFFAEGSSGLRIMDVSNPSKPTSLGSCANVGDAKDVALTGNYAVVAGGTSGVHLVDVGDPTNPIRVGGWSHSSIAQNVTEVVICGANAFALVENGVQRVDISDPKHPFANGAFFQAGPLTVFKNRIFVGGSAFNADSLLPLPGTGTYGAVSAVGGDRYYIADDSLAISNISDPSSPVLENSYIRFGYPWYGYHRFYRLSVEGDRAFAVMNWSQVRRSLAIFDVASSSAVSLLGRFRSIEPAALAVRNGYAYLGVGGRLDVVDVNKGANPQTIIRKLVPTRVFSTAVTGNYALLTEYPQIDGSGPQPLLSMYDVSNPANPIRVGEVLLPGLGHKVVVAGTLAYVVAGAAGVHIVDISDPANPHRVGGYDTLGEAFDVAVDGDHAYVLDYGVTEATGGLRTLDVSNPSNPQLTGSLTLTGAQFLGLSGRTAYIAGGNLLAVDLSDPSNPRIIGETQVGQTAGLVVRDKYAFVAAWQKGFLIFDLTTAKPAQIASVPATEFSSAVGVFGNYAYVVDSADGVHVYDVRDVAKPIRVGGNSVVSGSQLLASAKGLFVSGEDDGLYILNLFDESQPRARLHAARSRNGALHVIAQAPSGDAGRILRSTDLKTWVPWKTITFDGSILDLVEDASGDGAYYRYLSP